MLLLLVGSPRALARTNLDRSAYRSCVCMYCMCVCVYVCVFGNTTKMRMQTELLCTKKCEYLLLTKCECNGPCTKKCEYTDEIVRDRTTNPCTHPFPASPSPLAFSSLLLSSSLLFLHPLFCFLFSKLPFPKRSVYAKMHSAYEHPKKIFSTVFLQRDYFISFFYKNVAKQTMGSSSTGRC